MILTGQSTVRVDLARLKEKDWLRSCFLVLVGYQGVLPVFVSFFFPLFPQQLKAKGSQPR